MCAVLGFRRIMADNKMLYVAIAFLVFDIAILFASHYAFTYVAIRMR